MKPRALPLAGLSAPVRVARDAHDVPHVVAACREDAFRAWGWLHARDRFFQMDLLRRAAAGRLAALLGPAALPFDREQRLLPMHAAARRAAAGAPPAERALLAAYARGANAALAARRVLPVEYLLLRTRPEPWEVEDSLLVMLGFFQQLALDVEGRRCHRVMREALPPEVAAFFAPRADAWSDPPEGDAPVPVAALTALMHGCAGDPAAPVLVDGPAPVNGSNCWAVAAGRTARGVPLLANDMHLPLGAPNLWHRVELEYGGTRAAGIAAPGAPVLVSGSNGTLAWGMTNLPGDVSELVELDADAPVTPRVERIEVRGRGVERVELADSAWGPVIPEPVCGRRVALQWSALWPGSVHFGLARLAEATTLDQAIRIAHDGGCPPLNLHLAHATEGIARTVCGRIPVRRDGRLATGEWLPPSAIPRVVNPPEGFLVTANDAVAPGPRARPPGWNHPGACRRARIAQRLAEHGAWTEAECHALQRDTRAVFYDLYHGLALRTAGSAAAKGWPTGLRRHAVAALEAWDGHARASSVGLPLIAEFRRTLLAEIFAWLLRPCLRADPSFRYTWRNPEPPLRRLLRERPPELLPHRGRFEDWDAFLAHLLRAVAERLSAQAPRGLDALAWGDWMRVEVRHPLGRSRLTRWLNLPPLPSDGADECVSALAPGHGPAQRSVVAPGHEEAGVFQMPGGQSGHVFSRHHADHHRAWLEGRALPFRSPVFHPLLCLVPRATRPAAPAHSVPEEA